MVAGGVKDREKGKDSFFNNKKKEKLVAVRWVMNGQYPGEKGCTHTYTERDARSKMCVMRVGCNDENVCEEEREIILGRRG